MRRFIPKPPPNDYIDDAEVEGKIDDQDTMKNCRSSSNIPQAHRGVQFDAGVDEQ
eukprot:CAMPEP_0114594468 /NCGR_PEP_ID=MMETSP0125-20121206/16121_1 /TAXON_ID=485358 ORGANISM="Aristerostoma sp., Strain ATCC 50986" /NCGR_SAMPLE_ID=MMETSP0125 /ASSEMBLY_ACC=CAM_ASM_000245 /LENGTH=54 /DNA_ID=CAMNT_0001794795 /DNA_START=159 /DNA_END=323 /DNA_ORIENTATION=-